MISENAWFGRVDILGFSKDEGEKDQGNSSALLKKIVAQTPNFYSLRLLFPAKRGAGLDVFPRVFYRFSNFGHDFRIKPKTRIFGIKCQ